MSSLLVAIHNLQINMTFQVILDVSLESIKLSSPSHQLNHHPLKELIVPILDGQPIAHVEEIFAIVSSQ